MQHVMRIIVPLRIEAFFQQARRIVVIFQNQMYVTLRVQTATHKACHLGQPVTIGNGMNRIQTQAVKTILPQPVQSILGKKGAHLRLAKVNGRPRSEEHTSELQSLMRTSYAVFCLKKKNK